MDEEQLDGQELEEPDVFANQREHDWSGEERSDDLLSADARRKLGLPLKV